MEVCAAMVVELEDSGGEELARELGILDETGVLLAAILPLRVIGTLAADWGAGLEVAAA